MRGLVAQVSAYEEIAVDAAAERRPGPGGVRVLAHRCVGQYEWPVSSPTRLIAENAGYMPPPPMGQQWLLTCLLFRR